MRVLIVAATWMEVRLIADEFKSQGEINRALKCYSFGGKTIDILVAGIGAAFTTFHLSNTLAAQKYALVLNVGIVGSFSKELKIGQVVNVASEEFADLGIEESNRFLTLFDSGFIGLNEFPFENGVIKNDNRSVAGGLQQVRGITSDRSTGSSKRASKLVARFNPQVESMEGAAVFYVCRQLNMPFLEIRAISNYVGPRDPSKWDIPLALENLKSSVLKVIEELNPQ